MIHQTEYVAKVHKTVHTDWPASRETVHECSAETNACKADRPARQLKCWWSSWIQYQFSDKLFRNLSSCWQQWNGM